MNQHCLVMSCQQYIVKLLHHYDGLVICACDVIALWNYVLIVIFVQEIPLFDQWIEWERLSLD